MGNVQVIKDTFYASLRDRVAAGNVARTAAIRGVLRPGVVVVENELPGAALDGIAPVEAFSLRWTGMRGVGQGLVALLCEIRYATDGSVGAVGMDRGRALAAMDAELLAAASAEPRAADALVFAGAGAGGTPSGLGRIFWGDLAFGAAVIRAERMERVAEIEVFGYV